MSGREGEIWISYNQPYTEGKNYSPNNLIRTKYLQEINALIVELTPCRKKDRPFQSAVLTEKDAKGALVKIDNMGTEFDQQQMKAILQEHTSNPGSVRIKVRF